MSNKDGGGKLMFWGILFLVGSAMLFVNKGKIENLFKNSKTKKVTKKEFKDYGDRKVDSYKKKKENSKKELLKKMKKAKAEKNRVEIEKKKVAELKAKKIEMNRKLKELQNEKGKINGAVLAFKGDKKDSLTAEQYYQKSKKAQNRGDFAVALINIDKALSKDPKNSSYLRYKAYYLHSLKQYKKNISFIYKYIDSGEFEKDYYSYYILGESQFELKRFRQAKSSYKKSIKLKNNYYYSYLGLGKSMIELEDYKRGGEYLLIAKKYGINRDDLKNYSCKVYKKTGLKKYKKSCE